jgi:uncharacterized protein VirK/YbjX
MNEIKELKDLSNGAEIDVTVTIDEEEYREVYWNLILSEIEGKNRKTFFALSFTKGGSRGGVQGVRTPPFRS